MKVYHNLQPTVKKILFF